MTKEEKELIVKDICGRLPYGLLVDENVYGIYKDPVIYTRDYHPHIDNCKPYLRPISSMTEKELEEYIDLIIPVGGGKAVIEEEKFIKVEDFYNQHLLDYRGLIPKGLALEALEGMYNIENI